MTKKKAPAEQSISEGVEKLLRVMLKDAQDIDKKMKLDEQLSVVKTAMDYEELKLKKKKGSSGFGKGFDVDPEEGADDEDE